MLTVRIDHDIEESHDADQGVIDKDGTLTLYKWLSIGPYKCPLHKTVVVTFAPGKWASFSKDS